MYLAATIPFSLARPERPTDRYAAPLTDFLPTIEAKRFESLPVYGIPQPEYGPVVPVTYGSPSTQKLITKNIYLHVPPQEEEYQPAQVFEKPIPKKHYKIVFIKGKFNLPKVPNIICISSMVHTVNNIYSFDSSKVFVQI